MLCSTCWFYELDLHFGSLHLSKHLHFAQCHSIEKRFKILDKHSYCFKALFFSLLSLINMYFSYYMWLDFYLLAFIPALNKEEKIK